MSKNNWSSAEIMVNEFCTQLAKMIQGHAEMRAWYNFEDKRPGTVSERLQHDADNHAAYTRLFQP